MTTPGGTKYDSGKAPIAMLPGRPLADIARALEFGARKYDVNNWRKGFVWTRTASAAQRHIFDWLDGEDNCPESGLCHLAHAAANLLFLLEFTRTHPELDDRYKGEKSA